MEHKLALMGLGEHSPTAVKKRKQQGNLAQWARAGMSKGKSPHQQ